MAEIVWTDGALRDYERITAYITTFSPLAAQRMAARLRTMATGLQTFPMRGRSISGGRCELTIAPPYLIRYRVEGDLLLILEIRHAAHDSRTPSPTPPRTARRSPSPWSRW